MVKEGELFFRDALQQVGIRPQFVGDSFILSREETEKAEVAEVVPDILGDLVKGLGEIDDAAVPVLLMK